MMWGFNHAYVAGLDPNVCPSCGALAYIDFAAIHELNHARFLTDTYDSNITGLQVQVLDDNGQRIYPENDGIIHGVTYGGWLMGGAIPAQFQYGEYEINWLNRFARRRPLPGWGAWNASAALTEYMFILGRADPLENRLVVRRANGTPISGAQVLIYQRQPGGYLTLRPFDNVPEVVGTTNAAGEFDLGAHPYPVPDYNGWNYASNALFLRIKYGGQEHRMFLDMSDFNVHWFRGEQSLAVYPVDTQITAP